MCSSDLKREFFEGVKLVHIEGYTLLRGDLTLKAMEMAKQAGAKVSFDLASFELAGSFKKEIIDMLTHHVDILFANADETRSLTGLTPDQGCSMLKDLCDIAVVSLNKDGCLIGHGPEVMHCIAYPVEPLDTTGAGDLFAAGFLHGYLTGQSLPRCAHYGALTAAEVVQVFGAEIPDETWQHLRKKILS